MLNCRSCLSENVTSIIPLGNLPLANALSSSQHQPSEPIYNLEVMLCRACGLAQLKDLIDPKDLFSNYVYFSSNSKTMLASVSKLVNEIIIPALPRDAFVVEIASNDGYLLKNYTQKGIPVLGIDPAENIAKIANANGIPTRCAFFGEALAHTLKKEGNKADVIHANNVMAHVPDINGFMKGLKILLKESGTAVIEVPHLLELAKKLEFDTIYHEHVYYFSAQALKPAFQRHGLEIFSIEKIALHGGSLRLFVGHANVRKIQATVDACINEERSFEIDQPKTYIRFMKKIEGLKNDLRAKLNDLKSQGATIAAYGASAKGTTLLNYFSIGKEFIDFVVDRSPVKQGMYTPCTQLEILCPTNLVRKNISHALLLSWNFTEEILNEQKEFLTHGGRFIIPLPEVVVMP